MSDWQWFEEYEAEVYAQGDMERIRLLQFHRDAFDVRETDPDRTLALFAEGRRQALALGEPWWVMLYQHWEVHGTLYYNRDYHDVLDRAVRNALEVRKPKFAGFPQRVWIYNDLVNIYLNLDPRGYAVEIEQALSQAEGELTPEMDNSPYLLRCSRFNAASNQNRWDDALAIALRTHAIAQADPNRWTADHFLINNFLFLCHVGHQLKQWSEVAAWAAAGEELARQRDYPRAVAVLLMWRAACAMRNGDKEAASRFQRTAASRMGRLKTPLTDDYYDALCTYHELTGNPERSMRLRDQQLQESIERGMIFREFEARLARLRLLREMGQPLEQDLSEARAATNKFRRPDLYLPDIDRLLAEM